MRAKTKKKHEMGKRFALVIGVAAVGVMALGAQTGAAAQGVEYNTKLWITTDRGFWIHGFVLSDRDHNPRYDPAKKVTECMDGREVTVFKKQPGADRMLATALSQFIPRQRNGQWTLSAGVGRDRLGITLACMPR